MKTLLILDYTCPRPYSAKMLLTEAMGGTEATVIRIATALAKTNNVIVAQHNRLEADLEDGVHYIPIANAESFEPSAVIHLRTSLTLPFYKEKFQSAKHVIWLHDIIGAQFIQDIEVAKNLDVNVICVSRYHKNQVIDVALRCIDDTTQLKVKYIYNPVCVKVTGQTVDPTKLVFFSSPHKGLQETIENFQALRHTAPEFKLYVANPGYDFRDVSKSANVIDLGPLPHAEVIKHVESAFAVYYPNFVVPETFGLVMAEANAVGTPVLAHPFGAAREVLGSWQLCDGRKDIEFNEKILSWKKFGRPASCKLDPRFKLETVVDQWKLELDLM